MVPPPAARQRHHLSRAASAVSSAGKGRCHGAASVVVVEHVVVAGVYLPVLEIHGYLVVVRGPVAFGHVPREGVWVEAGVAAGAADLPLLAPSWL